MPNCNVDRNLKECKCTYNSCSRRGKCCECVAYHLKNSELPGCFFSKDLEKTYDRSIEKYITQYKK
ncbi:MAG: DUF6485 family protein [Elusimicrobia bacterium]|nr:DUF6485 family protein [Elusimicrobiota bacterium]